MCSVWGCTRDPALLPLVVPGSLWGLQDPALEQRRRNPPCSSKVVLGHSHKVPGLLPFPLGDRRLQLPGPQNPGWWLPPHSSCRAQVWYQILALTLTSRCAPPLKATSTWASPRWDSFPVPFRETAGPSKGFSRNPDISGSFLQWLETPLGFREQYQFIFNLLGQWMINGWTDVCENRWMGAGQKKKMDGWADGHVGAWMDR